MICSRALLIKPTVHQHIKSKPRAVRRSKSHRALSRELGFSLLCFPPTKTIKSHHTAAVCLKSFPGLGMYRDCKLNWLHPLPGRTFARWHQKEHVRW